MILEETKRSIIFSGYIDDWIVDSKTGNYIKQPNKKNIFETCYNVWFPKHKNSFYVVKEFEILSPRKIYKNYRFKTNSHYMRFTYDNFDSGKDRNSLLNLHPLNVITWFLTIEDYNIFLKGIKTGIYIKIPKIEVSW